MPFGMKNLNCFSPLIKKKKKAKGDKAYLYSTQIKILQARYDCPEKSSETVKMIKSNTVPVAFGILGKSRSKVKVMSHESPVHYATTKVVVAYERDETNLMMHKAYSDFDPQARVVELNEENDAKFDHEIGEIVEEGNVGNEDFPSDNQEPYEFLKLGKMKSPESFVAESSNHMNFQGGFPALCPQNQWVVYPTLSPLTRVNEWVSELANQHPLDDNGDGIIVFPPSPDREKSPARNASQIVHSNDIIQSLNPSSTVADISGLGLKVIPAISCFSGIRSVNLSGNSIVHVASGSLPKGLQYLNLSRNNIIAIEGFRGLTRLRILDLSYNRISRLGRGLSYCTLIKELYLAGNKISDIEGLHRLLKLTVLDMSCNKIATAKGLGQLVANYNSLLALNLLGNPIQNNLTEEQLRKPIRGLLPKLAYLNKQSINPQRAREVSSESVAKAARRNSSRSSHGIAVKGHRSKKSRRS